MLHFLWNKRAVKIEWAKRHKLCLYWKSRPEIRVQCCCWKLKKKWDRARPALFGRLAPVCWKGIRTRVCARVQQCVCEWIELTPVQHQLNLVDIIIRRRIRKWQTTSWIIPLDYTEKEKLQSWITYQRRSRDTQVYRSIAARSHSKKKCWRSLMVGLHLLSPLYIFNPWSYFLDWLFVGLISTIVVVIVVACKFLVQCHRNMTKERWYTGR